MTAVSGVELELLTLVHDVERLGGPHDIELQGDLAFVAGKWGAFSVLDVTVPAEPSILSSITRDMDNAETVLPDGEICFLGTNDFLSVDVSDPGRPRVLKRLSDPRIDCINGMVRWQDTILAANKSGFVDVFDVSDPADPLLADALDTRRLGGLLSPHDIALWGDRIFVLDQQGGSPSKGRIYRFADGGQLRPSAEWSVEGSIAGEDLDGANRIVIDGDHAYVAANKACRVGVIDIRDPRQPVQVANLPVQDASPCGMALDDGLLFVGSGRTLQAIDVSAPGHPVPAGHCTVFPETPRHQAAKKRGDAHDLVVRDGLVYVTGQNDSSVAVVRALRQPSACSRMRARAANPIPE